MMHILVVEDSRMISTYMKTTIEEELELPVTVARDYAQAEAVLRSQAGKTREGRDSSRFFLAVVDLNLPDAPNGEVVDLVLKHGLTVVVLTSEMNRKIRDQIITKGAADFVVKSRDSARQVKEIIQRLILNREETILVVDDSDFLRKTMISMLSTYGLHTLEARNGVEALKVLDQHSEVRLVVTDYEMPEMDGFQLCQAIRQRVDKNELAIIGVSSFEDELLSAKLIKSGANDFLAKPFQREELYCRIVQNLETLEYIKQLNSSLMTIRQMNTKMKRDLEAAAKLQQSLMPDPLPAPEGVTLASLFRPCDELAGDTYNAFLLDENHLALYILDVSGHGVPSALLSVTLTRIMSPDRDGSLLVERDDSIQGYRILEPAEVCALLNKRFPMNPETFQYFTLAYALLDMGTGRFHYATAGHPGPVHLSQGKKPATYATMSPAIGMIPGQEYKDQEFHLRPGDRLYFYTDGIVESRDEKEREFGLGRMREMLQAHSKKPLQTTLNLLHGELTEWNAGTFKDDVTLLALEYLGE